MSTKNIGHYLDRLKNLGDLLDRVNPKFDSDDEYFNTPNYVPNKQDLNLIEEIFNLTPNSLVKKYISELIDTLDKNVEFYIGRHVNPNDLVILLCKNDVAMFDEIPEKIACWPGYIKVRKNKYSDHDKSEVRSIEDCKKFNMCDLTGLE